MYSTMIALIAFFLALSVSASPYLPQINSMPRRPLTCAEVSTFNNRLDRMLHTRLPSSISGTTTISGRHDELIALQSFLAAYQQLINAHYSSCSPRRDVSSHENGLSARQAGDTSLICEILEVIFGNPDEGSSSAELRIAPRTVASVVHDPVVTATAVLPGSAGMHMLLARQEAGGLVDLVGELLFVIFGCEAQEGGGGGQV